MNQEASFTFTTPLNVNVVVKEDGEHTFVEGDISTNDIDLVNDVMTKECQESMQRQILEKNLKLDLEHEAFKGDTHEEREISKTKIPAGKLVDAMVKSLGDNRYSTRVKGEINRHRQDYKNIKGNLEEGFLDAFSVAFLPIDVKYEKQDGKKVRKLNDVILLNVALTGNPCNTKAQLTNVFMKSMDAVEEYKKLKSIDPEVEKNLVVKSLNKEQKQILDDVIKYMESKFGTQLTNQKSNSLRGLGLVKTNELNRKESNMTKDNANETDETDENSEESDSGDESNETEQKAMLKSISENLKSMNDKLDAVTKEYESLKSENSEMKEKIEKIDEALKQPIHKSPGVQKDDAEAKANAKVDEKSKDPLSVFK